MRVVEKEMIDAINKKASRRLGGMHPTLGVNTEVRFDADDNCSAIFLFGNHIADYWHGKEAPLEVNINTLEDFPTKTTISRLRALGSNIRTVKGVIYLDGFEV